jgi:predicted membrane-bound spermidine synthase
LKALTIILGLIFLAAGIVLIWVWRHPVLSFVKGGVAIALVFAGLGALIIGISEIKSAAEEKRLAAEVSPAASSGQQPEPKAEGEKTGS